MEQQDPEEKTVQRGQKVVQGSPEMLVLLDQMVKRYSPNV